MIFENYGYWTEIKNLGRVSLKIVMCSNVYEIWHLLQIEHANYEYCTWNWWSWPKIMDSSKFGPNTEICSNFYEIWHSQQIEHANYESNTHQSRTLAWLLAQNDYRLRMIIGCKIRSTIRTWSIIALTPR